MTSETEPDQLVHDWQKVAMRAFLDQNIQQVAFVPDGGLKGLLELCQRSDAMTTTVLTSEEEGIAIMAGAWLGGQRGVLLMQSSGVGNCLNMLTLGENCRIPLVMLVTMRGEWGEFIPWQIPMGKRTRDVLETMGVDVYRVETSEEAEPTVSAGIAHAFNSNRSVAILLAQKMIGQKNWGNG